MANKTTVEKKGFSNNSDQNSRKNSGGKKSSEYGRQLAEKQKVKKMYNVRERQFRRFFVIAEKTDGAPGENLLSLLERRLDNVIYRLKFATSRSQARQIVAHGHVLVNGIKIYSPSYLVSVNDVVSLDPKTENKKEFLEQVVEKRLKMGIKVPDWVELDKNQRIGKILRNPVRADIQVPIEENLIVELYSK